MYVCRILGRLTEDPPILFVLKMTTITFDVDMTLVFDFYEIHMVYKSYSNVILKFFFSGDEMRFDDIFFNS